MFNKLKNMIKTGFLSSIIKDNSIYPKAQVKYNGKTNIITRLSPYGLDSQPPTNSLVVMLSNQGQESCKYGIISDILNRKKNLEEGEVVLYNSETGTYIYLKENGDIELSTDGNLEANVGGNTTISTDGNLVATAATIALIGNVTITGTLQTTGNITAPGASVNGIDFENHVHSQGIDSDNDTQQDTGGAHS